MLAMCCMTVQQHNFDCVSTWPHWSNRTKCTFKLRCTLLATRLQLPVCRAIHPADLLSSKGVWPGTAARIPFTEGLEGRYCQNRMATEQFADAHGFCSYAHVIRTVTA
jgi:hypothetical protein